jgi:diguanylate cyclase (GGDEF)-like protein
MRVRFVLRTEDVCHDTGNPDAEHAAVNDEPGMPSSGIPDPGALRDPGQELVVQSYAFARRLAQLAGSDRLSQFIVETLARTVKAEQASLAVYDEREGYLEFQASRGYPVELVRDRHVTMGEGLIGGVLASPHARIITDVAKESRATRRRPRYRTPSCLLVPLMAGGKLIAVVSLADRLDGQAFNRSDLTTARALAAPAALALMAQRLQDDKRNLEQLVATDPLTGLFNRRSFEVRLDEELNRALRHDLELNLMLIDVDGFKAINDSIGHAAGDAVLRGVASVIRRSIRVFDVSARQGGDEFVILMQGRRVSAMQSAERLRSRIESWRPERSLGLPSSVQVTASIGLASLSRNTHTTPQSFMASADRALLVAKAEGRNRVRVAE